MTRRKTRLFLVGAGVVLGAAFAFLLLSLLLAVVSGGVAGGLSPVLFGMDLDGVGSSNSRLACPLDRRRGGA